MKTFKLSYVIVLISSFALMISCTDSTTDDAFTGDSGQDPLFSSIAASKFTGVYDTLEYTLLVNTISQKEYESLTSKEVNKDSLRKVVCGEKEGGCMEAMELFAISKFKDKVIRNNNELILQLSSGKSVKLINVPAEDDSYEVYQFLDMHENGYYIVAGYYMESYNYLMINPANGKITYSIGVPSRSPDNKKYIAVNYDMIAAFTFNGMEFFSIEKDNVISEAKIDFITWGPEEFKWKDDSTVYIKQLSQMGEDPKEESNFAAMRIRKRTRI